MIHHNKDIFYRTLFNVPSIPGPRGAISPKRRYYFQARKTGRPSQRFSDSSSRVKRPTEKTALSVALILSPLAVRLLLSRFPFVTVMDVTRISRGYLPCRWWIFAQMVSDIGDRIR